MKLLEADRYRDNHAVQRALVFWEQQACLHSSSRSTVREHRSVLSLSATGYPLGFRKRHTYTPPWLDAHTGQHVQSCSCKTLGSIKCPERILVTSQRATMDAEEPEGGKLTIILVLYHPERSIRSTRRFPRWRHRRTVPGTLQECPKHRRRRGNINIEATAAAKLLVPICLASTFPAFCSPSTLGIPGGGGQATGPCGCSGFTNSPIAEHIGSLYAVHHCPSKCY